MDKMMILMKKWWLWFMNEICEILYFFLNLVGFFFIGGKRLYNEKVVD